MQTNQNSTNIIEMLNRGTVAFTYTTVSGETRNAVGTTNSALLPAEHANTNVVQTGDNVSYFDTNVKGWRTFKLSRLDQSSITPA